MKAEKRKKNIDLHRFDISGSIDDYSFLLDVDFFCEAQ